MKMMVVIVAFSFFYTGALAQTQKKPVTGTAAKPVAVKKPVATGPNMKSSLDSFSYAVGISIANFYKEQGVKDINSSLVVKAINDVKNGKSLLTEEQINTCIVGFIQEAKSEKASPIKKEGEAFLAENKKKSGVVSLASGLQYEIMKEGTGAKPTADEEVKVHYHGTLLDGTIFDSSVQRGEPVVFGLKRVIAGWTEALQLMPVGSKWRLFVPSHLAYGDNQMGPSIKPGSTLIFEVELLDIVK
jgi:FKBP-type peptidyl-prolyl cis-trans isomerase FklB